VLGYAARLWQRYKDKFLQATDLLELVRKIADAIAEERPRLRKLLNTRNR